MINWALQVYSTECPVLRDSDAERTWREHVSKVNFAGC